MRMPSQLTSPSRALQITPSERQVLQQLANGQPKHEMAADLDIDALEFDALLTRLFAVLGAASEAEAIALAHRRGLLLSGPPDNPDKIAAVM